MKRSIKISAAGFLVLLFAAGIRTFPCSGKMRWRFLPHAEALKEYARIEAEAIIQGESLYPQFVFPGGDRWFKFFGNPILSSGAPGSWEEKAADCQTVGFYNGQYMMWYVGTPSSLHCQIGLATSRDGINWTKHPENPIIKLGPPGSWDSSILICESVLFDKDEQIFKIWYVGGTVGGIFGIGYATSPDGIHWTKYQGNPVITVTEPWEGRNIEGQSVLKTNEGYKIWFASYHAREDQASIGYATSPDGIHWTKNPQNPIFTPDQPGSWDGYSVDEPDIHYQDGIYHMWYKGWNRPMGVSWIGHATSQDGIRWERAAENPVLMTANVPQAWDIFQVYRPRVILAAEWEGEMAQVLNKMWYSGRPYSLKARLGYAFQFTPDYKEKERERRSRLRIVSQDKLSLAAEPASPGSLDLYYFTPFLDKISVTIYAKDGQKVRALVSETNFPGFYQTTWDGLDDSKKRAGPGIYFCEIRSSSHLLTQEIRIRE